MQMWLEENPKKLCDSAAAVLEKTEKDMEIMDIYFYILCIYIHMETYSRKPRWNPEIQVWKIIFLLITGDDFQSQQHISFIKSPQKSHQIPPVKEHGRGTSTKTFPPHPLRV